MSSTVEGSFKYAGDSQFWKMLAGAAKYRSEDALAPQFEALNLRTAALRLPVAFGGERSFSWAFICQIFLLYQDRMTALGRRGYLGMVAGSRRAFHPASFARAAIRRIVANVSYPSFPGRTVKQSVADTFLANGLSVTEGYEGPSMDGLILSRSLEDSEMMDLCDRIVTPPRGLWEEVTAYYDKNRPGCFVRKQEDLYSWIFER